MLKDKDGNIYCSDNCDKVSEQVITNDIVCPKCGQGHLVKRVASKGKSKGNEFYACNKFPKCKNIVTIEEYNNLLKK
jgi:ssDNA-binding Zn-finger/Zn-ribbon topoisomerase 1